MQENLNTSGTTQKFALLAVPIALLFVGAGCFGLGNRLAEDAIKPVTVPIESLKKSKEEIALANARKNEESDLDSADVTVALIRLAKEGEPFDGETIGCGDRVEAARVHRAIQTDSVLRDALVTLFSIDETGYDGLYNALAQSNLKVEDILSRDGVTTEVRLTGTLPAEGACSVPRIKAQIEQTIRRFKPNYRVILNGTESEYRCFGDMSGQCQ
jgi:hypothetical protein